MCKVKKTIQIGIPCGTNSEMYVSFLISSIESTISGDFQHEYILGVNQRGVDFDRFKKIKNVKIVEDYQNSTSSKGHGHCLDLILKNMKSEYGMFVDSDVAFLEKSWDRILIDKLDKDCLMIGSEYHPADGKVVNFPNVITCLFRVKDLQDLNLTFVPELRSILPTEETAPWYGVSPGSSVYLDTGCHIAENFGRSGFKWKTMKIVTPRYKDRLPEMKFMKLGMRGEEYQVEGIPICTHIGRSLNRNFESDSIVISWKKRVKEWIDGKV